MQILAHFLLIFKVECLLKNSIYTIMYLLHKRSILWKLTIFGFGLPWW
jgi:hypothetical protein